NHRRAGAHRQIHYFANLGRVGARERAAEDSEVLREHEHGAAADGAVAGHHTIAEDLLLLHAEVGAAVGDEFVELDERAWVEEQLQALARGELAGGVLAIDALLAATGQGARLHLFERLQRVWIAVTHARPSLCST